MTPWTAAPQASLSFTISPSLLKITSTESVMLSNHPVIRCPLLLLPSILPGVNAKNYKPLGHKEATRGRSQSPRITAWRNTATITLQPRPTPPALLFCAMIRGSVCYYNLPGWLKQLHSHLKHSSSGGSGVLTTKQVKFQLIKSQLSLSPSHIHAVSISFIKMSDLLGHKTKNCQWWNCSAWLQINKYQLFSNHKL